MFKNYLKIAWRNLSKNKIFSIINIVGLAIGLACFILIALYVVDELSYDRYNEKADRIYRVDSDIAIGGSELKLAVASDPMGATLKKDYPEVEAYTRFYSNGSKLIKKGDEYLREDKVAYADSTLFEVFTFPLIEGDPAKALTRPNTAVISEDAAQKYFGTTNCIGKMLETNNDDKAKYAVTGVMKNIPKTSHIDLDFILSMHNVQYDFGNFLSNNFPTYIVLRPGADPKAFNKNFQQVINKYLLPQAKEFMQINSMEEFEKGGNRLNIFLTPLTDIHLHSDKMAEMGNNSSIQYVYIFSAVALFILLIACINFMNLSTARSSNRAREVGIRKVLGTGKQSLIRQFLTESILMAVIAMFVGVCLVLLAMPFFNNISGKELSLSTLIKPAYLLFLVLLPLIVGFIAGIYPAFFLSSFRPVAVLKGKINAGFKKSALRSGLVIFQFATSIILIIGTIVIYRQLHYIQNKKLGFTKEQVLVVDGTSSMGDQVASVFKNEVLNVNGVKNATFSGYLPVSNSARSDNTYSKDAVMDSRNALNMQTWDVDEQYINTLGMELAAGRNFSKDFGTDSTAILINETAAAMLGYENNAVGKKLYRNEKQTPYTIIGVVKNFHFESLRQNIGPVAFRLGNADWATSFKVSTKDLSGLISQVEKKYKALMPGMPFRYRFLDDSFNEMYRAESRAGQVAIAFAVLAIFIACLGLFGLATYMAEQRTKEIGVRKVLGASVSAIVNMLSKDFLKLVGIATILSFPLAWLMMHKWLEDFAYRTNISWWIFLVAAIITTIIAIATVSFQAIKAALNSPVKSLRSE